MLSLALAQMAERDPDLNEEHSKIIDSLIRKALLRENRAFDTELWNEDALETLDSGRGHLGYLGHLNLIIGAFRRVSPDPKWDELSTTISKSLMERLDSDCPVDETYPYEIYVPDVVAAVASLKWAALPTETFINKWVQRAKEKLISPETGLLAFAVEGKECRQLDSPRGTGVGWNSFFLPAISQALARDQYTRTLNSDFFSRIAGIYGLREWMPGQQKGIGDIDSGPVVFGISPAGTLFFLSAALRYSNAPLATDFLRLAELIGFTMTWESKSHFLTGPLVVDAIMLAVITTPPDF